MESGTPEKATRALDPNCSQITGLRTFHRNVRRRLDRLGREPVVV